MMGTGEVAAAVKAFLGLRRLPNVVLDPVILSSSGHALLDNAGIEIMRAMLPLCDVITPNIAEAAILTGFETVPENQSWDAALPAIHQMTARLHELGVKAAVITGGHLNPPNDFLSYRRGGKIESDVFPRRAHRVPLHAWNGLRLRDGACLPPGAGRRAEAGGSSRQRLRPPGNHFGVSAGQRYRAAKPSWIGAVPYLPSRRPSPGSSIWRKAKREERNQALLRLLGCRRLLIIRQRLQDSAA